MNRCLVPAIVLATGLLAAIPSIFAWESGADAGYSGGPAGYFDAGGYFTSIGNCTECHEDAGLGGPGGVELVGVPTRYRAGAIYDFTVHVFDPDMEPFPFPPGTKKVGAGFEISAEGGGGHLGTFVDPLLAPPPRYTRLALDSSAYVTHTNDGVANSRENWKPDRAYGYSVQWQAPATNQGPITFFASGIVADNGLGYYGDRYYATHSAAQYAVPGDADGDTDLDLYDFAVLQRCFSGENPYGPSECRYLDADDDAIVSLADAEAFASGLSGPTAAHPAGYVLADTVRGGLLYDKWWVVAGLTPPGPTQADNHPLWPPFNPPDFPNPRTGADTWRCKECHGWDYKGVGGAYAAGNHYTGIAGVLGTTRSDQALFDMLKYDDSQTPAGHGYASVGLTDDDIWALVKMVREGVVDTGSYINADKSFVGDGAVGEFMYSYACKSCHDYIAPPAPPECEAECKGTRIDFGADGFVGTIANDNPWELLHKIRFSHPGSPMPSLELLGLSPADAADIGAYCATLRVDPCPYSCQ